MITTDITHIAHLVEICYQRGIRHAVLSPGSRNAPLIIAFDEHPGIRTWLIHDERCAAFFALGIADATHQPVAIACTSGSAPLNYAPAISEAYYRQVPLLILTADRPVALVDQGDGQTIRQKNVFQNFVKASFELPDFSAGGELHVSDVNVNEALDVLVASPQAPVHINIPLSEPLYGTAALKTTPQVNPFSQKSQSLTNAERESVSATWKKAAKKLILIGQLQPDLKLQRALLPVLNDPSVAVLVENTSNIQHFQKIVHCIDRTLAVISEQEAEAYAPDLLITLGGAVISKKIKAFFRKNKPAVNWRVGDYLFQEDTYQSLTHSFRIPAADFFDFVAGIDYLPLSNFGDHWKQKDFLAQDGHHNFLAGAPWSDLKAFEQILDTLPANTSLHMGNSSVVRYCQLFNPDQQFRYFSNRGVSGIDGSTSTAAGFSVIDENKLNVLISGDISFLYDSNAVWNNYLKNNFRIIVINNGGGGIFQILDGSSQVKQAPYFFSSYQADISKICEGFGVGYLSADDSESLGLALESFYRIDSEKPVLLEVKTFSQNSSVVLKAYFESLRNVLS
ncbi:MAG: 2-succinyl-5-enolpyruvyl-6-hydroxy-3-cyclohexene-1-carboxylic-acid synthase [Bacteroidetes bacterium]|nr:2-succinyl-5-enolpyruvyl-6-hydroxy-3-cyclohexene-1-carboxylic-acid synthase [Bacteroidota bacterium]